MMKTAGYSSVERLTKALDGSAVRDASKAFISSAFALARRSLRSSGEVQSA